MPLHELYRLAKGKLDSKEINSACAPAADQSSSPDNDFFELVWENGQISMQGQSSRARKSPTYKSLPSCCLPSHSPRGRDKDVGYATNTRMGKFGDLDTGLNEIPMPVPSGEVDLSQDEDVTPWLNYAMDYSLLQEFSSDFLRELSGVTMNELPPSNNFTLVDKRSDSNKVYRDSQKNSAHHVSSSEQGIVSKGASAGEVETSRPKASTSQLYPPSSHKCQTSFASVRSRVSDIAENNISDATQHASRGEITEIPSTSSGFSSLKMEKQAPNMSSNSSTIMNFSHFARPAAIVRANLQSLSSARPDSLGTKNKGADSTKSNPPESTFVDSSGDCPRESTLHSQQVMEPIKADLKPLEPKSLDQNTSASKRSDPACKEEAAKIDLTSNQVLRESGSKGQEAVEKSMEPVVASSSVCSGNGAERGSDDPNQNSKRKSRDTEDSECHSEDVEEVSVGVKKAAPVRVGMASKRSRAAEVHNLSERRRRDRINEKMRALQELIPNCNKVDKASMLDEAIEYLKTLQLQVQMMSMGAGLYMPSMMLPAGMQHFHPHMAPFSPMGWAVGYGMGVPDINGGSSRFPMVQVPPGTHLPDAHMSGPMALPGMARSNPQVFGFPGQGLPMPMPRAPFFSFSGGPLMNSSPLGLNACRTSGLVETVGLASTSSLKDQMPNVNSQVMQSASGCNSTSQNQMPAQPALVHNSGHASEVNDNGAVNPGKEDNLVTGKSCEL